MVTINRGSTVSVTVSVFDLKASIRTTWLGIRGYGQHEPCCRSSVKVRHRPSWGDWDLALRSPSSVGVEDEPWKGAVFVAVAPVSFAPIQLNENLIACIQMKDDAVAGVVIALVLVLGDGAGPDLEWHAHTRPRQTDEAADAHLFLRILWRERGSWFKAYPRVSRYSPVTQPRGSSLIRYASEKG